MQPAAKADKSQSHSQLTANFLSRPISLKCKTLEPHTNGNVGKFALRRKSNIIRPHRPYYVRRCGLYSYRPSRVACLSVGLSVCHTCEPCKNGWTDRDVVWLRTRVGPGNHVLDLGLDPQWQWAVFGEEEPIVSIATFCGELCKDWTDRFALCIVDSSGPKKTQVQQYSPGGANVVRLEGTLAPRGEYDWTVRLWRRCGLMSNYFDHLLTSPPLN